MAGIGIEAVESAIERGFGPTTINRRVDPDSYSTVLSLEAEGRIFIVRVSNEFDQDFPSGTSSDLEQLAPLLRATPGGTVAVTTTGIRPA